MIIWVYSRAGWLVPFAAALVLVGCAGDGAPGDDAGCGYSVGMTIQAVVDCGCVPMNSAAVSVAPAAGVDDRAITAVVVENYLCDRPNHQGFARLTLVNGVVDQVIE